MATVVTHAVPSLDGFIARPDDSVGPLAGDGAVAVCAGNVGGQAVAACLVDEVAVDVAPVLLGEGKRYFGGAKVPEGMLEDPSVVVQGDRVLHLRYRVRRTLPN